MPLDWSSYGLYCTSREPHGTHRRGHRRGQPATVPNAGLRCPTTARAARRRTGPESSCHIPATRSMVCRGGSSAAAIRENAATITNTGSMAAGHSPLRSWLAGITGRTGSPDAVDARDGRPDRRIAGTRSRNHEIEPVHLTRSVITVAGNRG